MCVGDLKILTEFNWLKCNRCIVCNYAVLIIVKKKIYIYIYIHTETACVDNIDTSDV